MIYMQGSLLITLGVVNFRFLTRIQLGSRNAARHRLEVCDELGQLQHWRPPFRLQLCLTLDASSRSFDAIQRRSPLCFLHGSVQRYGLMYYYLRSHVSTSSFRLYLRFVSKSRTFYLVFIYV